MDLEDKWFPYIDIMRYSFWGASLSRIVNCCLFDVESIVKCVLEVEGELMGGRLSYLLRWLSSQLTVRLTTIRCDFCGTFMESSSFRDTLVTCEQRQYRLWGVSHLICGCQVPSRSLSGFLSATEEETRACCKYKCLLNHGIEL